MTTSIQNNAFTLTDCHTADEESKVLLLKMNGNKANVFTSEFVAAMHECLDVIEREYPEHSVVLMGNDKAFSAGFDLRFMATASKDELIAYIEHNEKLLWRLFTFPRPVIAAINNHAIAGGMALASACDARIAAGVGRCGMNEVQNGFLLPLIVFNIVKQSMPLESAKRVILTGQMFDIKDMGGRGGGDGGDGLGWCERIVPPERLVATAIERASFAPKSMRAYAEAKALLNAPVANAIKTADGQTRDILARL